MFFARPSWFLALVVVPLLLAVERHIRGRDREALKRFMSDAMIERIARVSLTRVVTVRRILLALGLTLTFVALARPQWGATRERIERNGADVVIVLDTSLSMSVEDVAPNRFFLAKQALQSLMTQLAGDRFALVAFEGEAYALVPLTLDADAVGLFLETIEPGFVPSPGSNLLAGVERGIASFVDPTRVNRVLVVVSDGEDLEAGVDEAIAQAKKAGVVIHTVGVGTQEGGPVPDTDAAGDRNGYKLENGDTVISKLNTDTLSRLAEATGGTFAAISSADTLMSHVVTAIQEKENKQKAEEFSFRRSERFQIPLAFAYAAMIAGLFGPMISNSWRSKFGRSVAAAGIWLVLTSLANADVKDEVLGRPARLTKNGRDAYTSGKIDESLKAFEAARLARPNDPRTRFNEAVAQAQTGHGAEGAKTFLALSRDPQAGLEFEGNYNLGNVALQAKEFGAAVAAYRDALRLRPADENARRNLEIALREQQKQKEEQKKKEEQKQDQKQQDKQKEQPQPSPSPQNEPKNEEEKKKREEERFKKEAKMPKQQAMQLLAALEEKEKQEQKKRLNAERKKRQKGRDW